VVDLAGNAPAMARDGSPLAWSVLGVDLVGIALGLIFAGFARAYARRARQGDAHSVWALLAPKASGPRAEGKALSTPSAPN
jgi:hypothetical protein